jgi:sirohydrochlorin ferrochelatase
MTRDALLLIGRRTSGARAVAETHAERLRARGAVDSVRVATYRAEPGRELRAELAALDADRVFAVPLSATHTHDTTTAIPGALSFVPGEVRYCAPVGNSPAVTTVLRERARSRVPANDDTSLALVGFGSSSAPDGRRAVERHAARLRAGTDYGEVTTCYVLRNPAVECARYNVSGERVVAVPVFLSESEVTETEIPRKLELDRGGLEYAAPLGTHERVTEAIGAEVERERTLADLGGPEDERGFEATLTARRPVATDGEGR